MTVGMGRRLGTIYRAPTKDWGKNRQPRMAVPRGMADRACSCLISLAKSERVCYSRTCSRVITERRARVMDEITKQAAQEYLAAKLTEEEQIYEAQQNQALAVARSGWVWKSVKDSIFEKCREWNAVTQEETLTCKETWLGDLRIWCAAQSKQMTVQDRKSTRLNSSHSQISYAVFCLKK